MTDFLTTLKELVGKATKGPWARQSGYEPRVVCGPDRRALFRCYQDNVHGSDPEANAALICHLVNHAEDIVALVEALEAIATDSGYVPVEVDDDDPEPLEYALAKIMLYRMKAKQAIRNLEAKP